ncbi:transcriptional regulator, TetR family [Flagellimonas taeanensis]|uniref:Transcriptional regulator, TetR family n=1 Tax=Flagellimonas taeanensis TaxID=1005926 RepID=A0A1M6PZ98_9FLAO|nr:MULTISPECIES: TetR/AcrR family transcriptional regulator [Allomuricauda]MDC6385288.1 TetR/AcrR family transcriptional regulator [Muricauda sp. SK9]SFB68518.1 transcriptional regulator, TetR family [Allomuricauda taeanensis]SHK13269.1 transcriptional regulator, TetR family [Allomuricauda taeanensis]
MDTREELLEFAIENFTKFGSKRFSMDELAQSLGISKKTLYKHFGSKEELVTESLRFFLEKIRSNVDNYMLENPNEDQPLSTIIFIYKQGLMVLQEMSPSFLYGLDKYYPKASELYSEFKKDIVWNIVCPLLNKAQTMGQVRQGVKVKLVCMLFLSRMEDTVYSNSSLFDEYSIQELLEHIIINNLRGILTLDYLKTCPLEK